MSETSSRHLLPLLVAGQGQKDITHNEALEAVDALLHPLIISRTLGTPPVSVTVGAAWLIPDGAVGQWQGRDGSLAVWTAGGWRFFVPVEGFTAWLKSEGRRIRKGGAGWRDELPFEAAPVDVLRPTGGTVIDAEARAALAGIITQLAEVGLINPQ